MPDHLRITNWNSARHSALSWQADSIRTSVTEFGAQVACFTETREDFSEPLGGYSIAARGQHWSGAEEGERKVLLWSVKPWINVRESAELNALGGHVEGTTHCALGELDVIGLCIPFHMAGVRPASNGVRPWQWHKAYLQALRADLDRRGNNRQTIIIGDFNRRLPSRWGSKVCLDLMLDCFAGWEVSTTGQITGVDNQTVDHIAHSKHFKTNGIFGDTRAKPGMPSPSDHFGIFAEFELNSV